MKVFVSIQPQHYFLHQIAKDIVDINVIVPKGKNPYEYQPTPDQIESFKETKMYFTIGAPFEKSWLEKIKEVSPDIIIVPTDINIEKAPYIAPYHYIEHADKVNSKGKRNPDYPCSVGDDVLL